VANVISHMIPVVNDILRDSAADKGRW